MGNYVVAAAFVFMVFTPAIVGARTAKYRRRMRMYDFDNPEFPLLPARPTTKSERVLIAYQNANPPLAEGTVEAAEAAQMSALPDPASPESRYYEELLARRNHLPAPSAVRSQAVQSAEQQESNARRLAAQSHVAYGEPEPLHVSRSQYSQQQQQQQPTQPTQPPRPPQAPQYPQYPQGHHPQFGGYPPPPQPQHYPTQHGYPSAYLVYAQPQAFLPPPPPPSPYPYVYPYAYPMGYAPAPMPAPMPVQMPYAAYPAHYAPQYPQPYAPQYAPQYPPPHTAPAYGYPSAYPASGYGPQAYNDPYGQNFQQHPPRWEHRSNASAYRGPYSRS
jgi:hypothetical protein